MNVITLKKGAGVPGSDQLETAELALDTTNGNLYTKLADNSIALLNDGDGTVKDGSQNIDGGNASSIYVLDQVIDGGSA